MPPMTRKPLSGDPAGVLEEVTRGYVLLDDAVIAFADADEVAAVVFLVGGRTRLPSSAVERALAAKSSGPATLVCRAAGLGANTFSAVLRLRRRRLREDGLNPAHVLADFLQTPMEVAHGAVAMMKDNEEA
jgi:Uncharacterised protein conserved in bacteria (DUF2336)